MESASFLDEWSQWSTCSRSCGGGLRTRYQQCIVVASAQYVSHPDESVTEDVDIPKPRAVPRRQCSKDDPLDGIEIECCAVHFCPGTAIFSWFIQVFTNELNFNQFNQFKSIFLFVLGEETVVDQRYAEEVLYPGTCSVFSID